MRLLDSGKLQLDMTKLGFAPDALARFDTAIKKPWGMVLVTGPTGSGKTNTLYSALVPAQQARREHHDRRGPGRIQPAGRQPGPGAREHRPELRGVLRSFLRQDPNIILVGEIRDGETAAIAVKAALTGHLVLSTLHTNDAPSSINRLVNMGIEPFLVANSVNLVVAQRLVRRICEQCNSPCRCRWPSSSRPAGTADGRGDTSRRAGPRLRALQRHRLQGPRRAVRGHGDERAAARDGRRERLGARLCGSARWPKGWCTLRQAGLRKVAKG